jgi:endonuclease/exonuclease/phosphatase family metal-dependent hydrolase
MREAVRQVRIATYNIHKCRGLDRLTSPSRIAKVIQQLNADIVALQEVLDVRDSKPEYDQARRVSDEMKDYHWTFGENRQLHGGAYGNMTLSRWPSIFSQNYDLTWRHRERRGCLRTDFDLGNETVLHLFNVHLGTSFVERRHQARKLVSSNVLDQNAFAGPRVVVGDFNEWTRGLASRLMGTAFRVAEPRSFMRYRRTYPGVFPVLHLDHFYHDSSMALVRVRLHRSRAALVASDHLPLVAEFELS